MKMKPYLVIDVACHDKRIVEATSFRGACVEYVKQTQFKDNPKLSKMYNDMQDGGYAHTGYICGQSWMSVAELTFLNKKEK